MSYRAKTEKLPEEFNSIRTVNIFDFEKMQSPSQATGSWNIQVQVWLKYYILIRLMDRKKARGTL